MGRLERGRGRRRVLKSNLPAWAGRAEASISSEICLKRFSKAKCSLRCSMLAEKSRRPRATLRAARHASEHIWCLRARARRAPDKLARRVRRSPRRRIVGDILSHRGEGEPKQYGSSV